MQKISSRIPGTFAGAAIAILLVTGMHPVQANMRYQDYFPLRDSEDMMVYVWGLGKGLSWGNTMLENSGRRMLYCVPTNFDITADNLTRVIAQEAAYYDEAQLQRVTIEQLLTTGMIRAFPCEGGGRQ